MVTVYKKTVDRHDPATVCEALAAGTGLSKTRIKRAMSQGAAWIQRPRGKLRRIRRATAALRPGDLILLYYDEALLNRRAPQAHCLQDFLDYSIWYKPAGLMTQGTRFGDHCTLARQVQHYFNPPRKVLLVHRIDREATGIVIATHSRAAAAGFGDMFRQRRIEKYYQVSVRGDLTRHRTEGLIDLPLDGRAAATRYHMVRYDPEKDQSLVRVQIHTGRRHQIRRHFEMIGFPVMGDPRYGNNNKNQEGLQLVAFGLKFDCPLGHGPIKIEIDPDGMRS